MMPDSAIHEALDALNDVRWRETAFPDLQWYYAEGGVYIIRCKHGKPDASLCAIRARSADEAVARAAFDLHMADEKRFVPIGDTAAVRKALTKVSEWMAHRIATGGFEASATIPTMLEGVVLPALAKPPRNCDRFGGDIDKLREAFARESGLNPEEDFPEVFAEWLLATSTERKGGAL